jgi:hypothetical protein
MTRPPRKRTIFRATCATARGLELIASISTIASASSIAQIAIARGASQASSRTSNSWKTPKHRRVGLASCRPLRREGDHVLVAALECAQQVVEQMRSRTSATSRISSKVCSMKTSTTERRRSVLSSGRAHPRAAESTGAAQRGRRL